MQKNHGVPNGLDQVKAIIRLGEITRGQFAHHLDDYKDDLRFVGMCLCALYQAATCHRKCYGDIHVFETLAARAYNHGAASFHLIALGYYDEAFGILRTLGELSNIVSMGVIDKDALREWISCDEETRRKKYSPVKVRLLLENKGGETLMYASKSWYSNLSGRFVHLSPRHRPGVFELQSGTVGGLHQKSGAKEALSELATILFYIASIMCKYAKFDDLFKEMSDFIDELPQAEKTGRSREES